MWVDVSVVLRAIWAASVSWLGWDLAGHKSDLLQISQRSLYPFVGTIVKLKLIGAVNAEVSAQAL